MIAPFWFWPKHLWIMIVPFQLSTDNWCLIQTFVCDFAIMIVYRNHDHGDKSIMFHLFLFLYVPRSVSIPHCWFIAESSLFYYSEFIHHPFLNFCIFVKFSSLSLYLLFIIYLSPLWSSFLSLYHLFFNHLFIISLP